MTTFDAAELGRLLPALYLYRDAESEGSPLGALLDVVGEQLAGLMEDLAQSYDDHFVETCAEWVVPYVGDLVGVVPRRDSRAFVANVVAYRRRKGTAAVLEQLARDVTGLDARAVEMFELVATTQRLAHPRPHHRAVADLRDALALERVGTAFDPLPRTADVRRVASGRGRHNVPNVALFVWRLGARTVTNVAAQRVAAARYRLSPLGDDVALVTRPEAEAEVEHLAGLRNVPWPLSRRHLAATLGDHYGPAGSIRVSVDDVVVPVERIRVCDLSDWSRVPTEAGAVALDPVLGRLAFADDPGSAPVRATFAVAASGRLGGGEYVRAEPADDDEETTVVRVPDDEPTITAALAALPAAGGVVEVSDSGRYAETPAVAVAASGAVTVRAATGRGPVLALGGDLVVTGGAESAVSFEGLRVLGGTVRVTGDVEDVALRHCTLVPGLALAPDRTPLRPDAPSLVVDAPACRVELDHCVTGPLVVPRAASLSVRDSVVDAPRRRAPGTLLLVAVSASLAAYAPPATSDPRLVARLAGGPPREVALAAVPATAADAADALSDALGVPVLLAGDRLVVLADVTFAAAGDDPTARSLGLLDGYRATATRGGALGALDLGAARALTVLPDGRRVALAAGPATADDAAAALRDALGDALVTVHEGALLVVPDAPRAVAFGEADDDDDETVAALRLATARHAIAGDLLGATPAPPVRLDAVTVVGAAYVREADLVSNTLCTAPLVALRRQAGCVRWSLLPAGSRTPRPHECAPPETQPDFVSLRFGDPAYARLHRAAPDAVRRGADDGGELGAYHELGELVREDDLRARLAEFLRFSLEAGVVEG